MARKLSPGLQTYRPSLSAFSTLQPKALIIRDSDSHPCQCTFRKFHGMTPFSFFAAAIGIVHLHWASSTMFFQVHTGLSSQLGMGSAIDKNAIRV